MQWIKRMTLTISLLAMMTATGQAQIPLEQQQPETIVVSSNLVTVNVIVTDREGRYVRGLKAEQFLLYDDNIKQQIAHFSVGPSPVSLGVVYEFDPTAPARSSAVLSALKQFVSVLRLGDTVFFTAYTTNGSVTADFIPATNELLKHFSGSGPGGPANLYDVLYAAAGRLRASPNVKRSLLVISDGTDTSSQHRYGDLENRLREFDAQIYTIHIVVTGVDQFAGYRRWIFEDLTRQTGRRSFLHNSEAEIGRAVLAEMSRVSGAISYSAESESEPELTAICTQIATELRGQYTLGFYPSKITSNSHKLKLRIDGTNSKHFSLSYRKSYQLAGKQSEVLSYVNVWPAPF
jgi:Ca-activated chloride channel homolog